MLKPAHVFLLLCSVPLRKGTETVYSELQTSSHGEFRLWCNKRTLVLFRSGCGSGTDLTATRTEESHHVDKVKLSDPIVNLFFHLFYSIFVSFFSSFNRCINNTFLILRIPAVGVWGWFFLLCELCSVKLFRSKRTSKENFSFFRCCWKLREYLTVLSHFYQKL